LAPEQSFEAIQVFGLPESMDNLIAFDEVQDEPAVSFPLPAAPVIPSLNAVTDSKITLNTPIYVESQDSQTSVPLLPTASYSNTAETSTVPRPIPKEVEVLVDAYIHNTLVLCIASNAYMTKAWSVTLPSEIEFAYLGFHKVVGVQVNSIRPFRATLIHILPNRKSVLLRTTEIPLPVI
jgi:hypothetical protein